MQMTQRLQQFPIRYGSTHNCHAPSEPVARTAPQGACEQLPEGEHGGNVASIHAGIILVFDDSKVPHHVPQEGVEHRQADALV